MRRSHLKLGPQSAQTAEWSHLFEFGNIGNNNVYCAPRADAGGFHSFGLSEGGCSWRTNTFLGPRLEQPHDALYRRRRSHHVNAGRLYQRGSCAGFLQCHCVSLTAIGTNNATTWVSPAYGDPNAILTIDEFRIYSGALTPAQIAHVRFERTQLDELQSRNADVNHGCRDELSSIQRPCWRR